MRITALLVAAAALCTAAKPGQITLAELARQSNESLLWGTYRPNVYFGTRPRLANSLLTGLMWSRVDEYQVIQTHLRHTCEQSDGMQGYGWEEYDPRHGGVQTVHDAGNSLDITTAFVKIPGGAHGGSWAVRVRGTVRPDAPPDLQTTAAFQISLAGLGRLAFDREHDPRGYTGDVVLDGDSAGLGAYRIRITEGQGGHPSSTHPAYAEKPLDATFVHGMELPADVIWQAKTQLFRAMKDQVDEYVTTYSQEDAPPPAQVYTIKNNVAEGNVYLVQKVFEGDWEFDVIFESGSAGVELDSQQVSKRISEVSELYWHKYDQVFRPQPPFATEEYKGFASSMFANLIGGVGYFHGDAVVDRSYAPEYDEENEGFWEETAEARARKKETLEGPSELLTAVPSRPFFPRGFLWDEGFHLLPIAEWDLDLTMEIVSSWFNLMDDDGWIAREQILGLEARSKVPPEFQVQYPHYANPPTLFFIVDIFVDKLKHAKDASSDVNLLNHEAGLEYLKGLYPKLKKLFYWFRKTQIGDLKSYDREAFSTKEGYRWRGRTVQHVLTSGLDDYPRPQPPHPGELHVDLMSWMGMMTRSMKGIAEMLGNADDMTRFATIETAIRRNLDDLHWSAKHRCYCDATIDAFEEHALICHKGYVSLFPFLIGLLDPEDEKLTHILDLLGDPEELWSEHGIRSLSLKDEFYGTGENYWRGPVWMPLNYMALVQLHRYATTSGPSQARATSLYSRLRRNLVQTVYESWKATGFAWEQYDPETGEGRRTQHFTGWTALAGKIMGMEELGEETDGVVPDQGGADGSGRSRGEGSRHEEL